jgi:tRNA-uridine 2-sulfurtransferase
MKKTVFVGLSGGVDSSVSAALLKKSGFHVVGVYMRCWDASLTPACTSQDDERTARLAAAHLGIPFYVWNFIDQYKEKVVNYLLQGYKKGLTPNPDVMCNKEIKFGLFYNKARELGADYVATGHYARIHQVPPTRTVGSSVLVTDARLRSRHANPSKNQSSRASEGFFTEEPGLFRILKAKDLDKDQSYFLAFVKPEVLEHVLFPIGTFTKPKVRELARKFGLLNAERKDSQGICFVGNIQVEDFLKDYIPEKKGPIVNLQGKVLGEHEGAFYYTIGQRRGIKLGGGPYYVVDKNVKTNTLVVSTQEKDVLAKEVKLEDINWFSVVADKDKVLVKLRYRQQDAPATFEKTKSGGVLHFEKEQRAITPGQFAVLYKDQELVAAGIIQ